MRRRLNVTAVIGLDNNRIALEVAPPPGIDLEFIYRAAMYVYWNRDSQTLEDRRDRAISQANSVSRIRRALADEYGLQLRAADSIRWEGVADDARRAIEAEFRC